MKLRTSGLVGAMAGACLLTSALMASSAVAGTIDITHSKTLNISSDVVDGGTYSVTYDITSGKTLKLDFVIPKPFTYSYTYDGVAGDVTISGAGTGSYGGTTVTLPTVNAGDDVTFSLTTAVP